MYPDRVEIPGYPAYYITPAGIITSKKTGIIKVVDWTNTSGYGRVSLYPSGKSLFVHRLVLMSFRCMPKDMQVCNHLDGNKRNNNVTNLEWTTAKENTRHAHATGLVNVEAIRARSLRQWADPIMRENAMKAARNPDLIKKRKEARAVLLQDKDWVKRNGLRIAEGKRKAKERRNANLSGL
jgi:hypothetical protein